MIVNSVAERGPVHGHTFCVTICNNLSTVDRRQVLYFGGHHGISPMPRPAPPPAPEPEPRTLFYPVEENLLAPEYSSIWGLLFVPILALLAVAAPLIVCVIPLCWIACKINGVPFTLNIPVLFDRIDSLCDQHNKPTKVLKK
jgi:hypothetical protein